MSGLEENDNVLYWFYLTSDGEVLDKTTCFRYGSLFKREILSRGIRLNDFAIRYAKSPESIKVGNTWYMAYSIRHEEI